MSSMQDRTRRFDTELVVQFDREASRVLDKDYWRVVRPFYFEFDDAGRTARVEIPAGYLTDGATVPRPFWWLLPPWSNYGQAAVVHDRLCERLTYLVDGVPTAIERSKADWIFKQAMLHAGVGYAKRTVMYWGVRFFTGLNMRFYRKRLARKMELESVWTLAGDYA